MVSRLRYTGLINNDVDKVVKYFNEHCVITCVRFLDHLTYKFIEFTPKRRKPRIDIVISKSLALAVINELDLVKSESNVFKGACEYKLKTF